MPKTFTIETFDYDELDTAARAKACDWYRSSTDDDVYWSEHVIEDATEILQLFGVELDANGIVWSGFCSQGDGASFTGTYAPDGKAHARVTDYAPMDRELASIATGLDHLHNVTAPIGYRLTLTRRDSRYSHPYTVEIGQIDTFTTAPDGTETEVDYEIPGDAILTELRRIMTWIYRTLETQYEHEQSDETVSENIRANEYRFTKDGSRITVVS